MTTIKVQGMKCQHCSGSVQKALENLDGISGVKVDLDTGLVSFDGTANEELVKTAVEKAGFTLAA